MKHAAGLLLIVVATLGFATGLGWASEGQVARGVFDCVIAVALFVWGVDIVRRGRFS